MATADGIGSDTGSVGLQQPLLQHGQHLVPAQPSPVLCSNVHSSQFTTPCLLVTQETVYIS
jgi:hypothetical protein